MLVTGDRSSPSSHLERRSERTATMPVAVGVEGGEARATGQEAEAADGAAIEHRAYARVGLLGNPSDVYFGRTISFSLGNFWASVRLEPSQQLVIRPHPVHDMVHFDSLHHLVSLASLSPVPCSCHPIRVLLVFPDPVMHTYLQVKSCECMLRGLLVGDELDVSRPFNSFMKYAVPFFAVMGPQFSYLIILDAFGSESGMGFKRLFSTSIVRQVVAMAHYTLIETIGCKWCCIETSNVSCTWKGVMFTFGSSGDENVWANLVPS